MIHFSLGQAIVCIHGCHSSHQGAPALQLMINYPSESSVHITQHINSRKRRGTNSVAKLLCFLNGCRHRLRICFLINYAIPRYRRFSFDSSTEELTFNLTVPKGIVSSVGSPSRSRHLLTALAAVTQYRHSCFTIAYFLPKLRFGRKVYALWQPLLGCGSVGGCVGGVTTLIGMTRQSVTSSHSPFAPNHHHAATGDIHASRTCTVRSLETIPPLLVPGYPSW
jgi:hypothetical protein